jgi:hypothetical protein
MDYIFSEAPKLLGLTVAITFAFRSIDRLMVLYFALLSSKFDNASVARNSVNSTDARNLERVQRKVLAPFFNSFCIQIHYN